MAFWYDLPAEVKQNILEHLVVGLHVKFEPRHAATRATRNAKQEEKDKEADSTNTDGLNSLLLVSKKFLTYNELEGALLTNATICIQDLRAFKVLEKRYGKEGLAMIRTMMIDPKMTRYEMARAGTRFPDLHSCLKTKMSNMQKITISLTTRFRGHFDCYLTYVEAINIAKGHSLQRSELSNRVNNLGIFRNTDDVAATGRKLTQQFLRRPLNYLYQKQDKWLTNLFNVKDFSRCEVVLEWEITFTADDWVIMPLERKVHFSSRSWCVTLQNAGEVVLCPQRLPEGYVDGDYPWLVESVNAIEHDKYYTI
ncbi:hypothetical protein PMZ80_006694 [Knufia obscura]|uniref:Uncharacterized protein n=1 Tax=Knufia obscura TaxID=1635080 RepID=A0ABR0RLB7_9EURO|nr:hypothetical protein PMZ80_006694 [Knufia obscura]